MQPKKSIKSYFSSVVSVKNITSSDPAPSYSITSSPNSASICTGVPSCKSVSVANSFNAVQNPESFITSLEETALDNFFGDIKCMEAGAISH